MVTLYSFISLYQSANKKYVQLNKAYKVFAARILSFEIKTNKNRKHTKYANT